MYISERVRLRIGVLGFGVSHFLFLNRVTDEFSVCLPLKVVIISHLGGAGMSFVDSKYQDNPFFQKPAKPEPKLQTGIEDKRGPQFFNERRKAHEQYPTTKIDNLTVNINHFSGHNIGGSRPKLPGTLGSSVTGDLLQGGSSTGADKTSTALLNEYKEPVFDSSKLLAGPIPDRREPAVGLPDQMISSLINMATMVGSSHRSTKVVQPSIAGARPRRQPTAPVSSIPLGSALRSDSGTRNPRSTSRKSKSKESKGLGTATSKPGLMVTNLTVHQPKLKGMPLKLSQGAKSTGVLSAPTRSADSSKEPKRGKSPNTARAGGPMPASADSHSLKRKLFEGGVPSPQHHNGGPAIKSSLGALLTKPLTAAPKKPAGIVTAKTVMKPVESKKPKTPTSQTSKTGIGLRVVSQETSRSPGSSVSQAKLRTEETICTGESARFKLQTVKSSIPEEPAILFGVGMSKTPNARMAGVIDPAVLLKRRKSSEQLKSSYLAKVGGNFRTEGEDLNSLLVAGKDKKSLNPKTFMSVAIPGTFGVGNSISLSKALNASPKMAPDQRSKSKSVEKTQNSKHKSGHYTERPIPSQDIPTGLKFSKPVSGAHYLDKVKRDLQWSGNTNTKGSSSFVNKIHP